MANNVLQSQELSHTVSKWIYTSFIFK